jgi:hypothetical protein
MPPFRRLVRLALLPALALPLACVNPFKPADPEPPDSSAIFEDFHNPEAVLQTMVVAIDSKTSGGTNAWVHAFADSQLAGDRAYRQFYDGAVKQNWETANSLPAPEPWDLAKERSFPTKLFGIRPLGTYSLEFSHDAGSENDDNPDAADTAQYHRYYVLKSVQGNNEEVIGTGYCDLSFQKTGTRWSIYRWHDRLDPTVGVNPSSDARTFGFWRLESLARQ